MGRLTNRADEWEGRGELLPKKSRKTIDRRFISVYPASRGEEWATGL